MSRCQTISRSVSPLVVLVISLLNAPLFAYMSEAEYRQEIKREVLVPCFSTIMRQAGLAGHMTVDEFLLVLRSQGTVVQMAEDKLLQQVMGKPKNVREILYRVGLNACLNGSKQAG